jgi:DMSO/TMAO reductase YedYZ heme-binding membrane subunit
VSAPTLGKAPLWYLSRSTGLVSFVLVTAALGLGIASTQRALASPRWPRFATQGLHRNVSLLALAFLGVHIVTTIADSYVNISWWAAFVPGASHYRGTWVALGTIAFDVIVAVIVSSLYRQRMNATSWRWLHYTVYAAWPLAWLHFLKTGTDAAHGRFGLWIALGAAAVVGGAVGARTTLRDDPAPVRSVVR